MKVYWPWAWTKNFSKSVVSTDKVGKYGFLPKKQTLITGCAWRKPCLNSGWEALLLVQPHLWQRAADVSWIKYVVLSCKIILWFYLEKGKFIEIFYTSVINCARGSKLKNLLNKSSKMFSFWTLISTFGEHFPLSPFTWQSKFLRKVNLWFCISFYFKFRKKTVFRLVKLCCLMLWRKC